LPWRLGFTQNRPELDNLHAMLRTSRSVARSMTCVGRLNKERNALKVMSLDLSICIGNILCMAFAFKLSPCYRKIDRSWKRTRDLFIYYGWHHVSGLITMIQLLLPLLLLLLLLIIIIMFCYKVRNEYVETHWHNVWKIIWMKAVFSVLDIWQHSIIIAPPPWCNNVIGTPCSQLVMHSTVVLCRSVIV
jgi:hypothetical protein